MFLKSRQVMERVDVVESTSVDKTHEQITNVSPMLGLKKQRIPAMEDSPFEGLFAEVVIQGCPWYSQKEGQRFPMLQHIADGLPHGGVRLHLPLIELFL